MSMCRVFSFVVARGCLLWPAYPLVKTLLAFALLHFVLQGQTCLFTPDILWLPTFAFQYPMKKRISFIVLVLEVLVGLHKTIQLQLLGHLLLGHRLGLLWCWVACPGNEPRSLLHFWGTIQFYRSFPGGASGKEPACQSRRHERCRFDPWVRKIPWRRTQQTTPVFLPGKSHEQRILVGCGP